MEKTPQRIGGPPGGLNQVKIDLTQAELRSLFASQLELYPAPGNDKFYAIENIWGVYHSAGTSFPNALIVNFQSVDVCSALSFFNSTITRQSMFDKIGSAGPINKKMMLVTNVDSATITGTATLWIQYRIIDTNA